MSDKLSGAIVDFMNCVGEYLLMEYKPKFYQEYRKDKNQSHFFDFVGSYYMGGSNVPDTARCVVELIKMNEREQRKSE
jgi:hypothetical protein